MVMVVVVVARNKQFSKKTRKEVTTVEDDQMGKCTQLATKPGNNHLNYPSGTGKKPTIFLFISFRKPWISVGFDVGFPPAVTVDGLQLSLRHAERSPK